MASYLFEVGYTPQAWGALMKNPQSRVEAVRPSIEALGGKIVCGYLTFGEYDLFVIVDGIDNVSAASFAIAAAAGGAVRAIKTTPLLTADEGTEAMRKAGSSGYKPPSS